MSFSRKDDKMDGKALSYEVTAEYYVDETSSGLQEKLSTSDVVVLAYMILATWIAYSGSIAVPLTSGGINVVFWGLLVTILANLATAASLAEVASLFPHGNQENWTFHLAPLKWKRFLAYTVGWTIACGWLLLGLAGEAITAQIILAMANLCHPSFEITQWQVAVVTVAVCVSCTLFGIFGSAILARANTFSTVWNLAGVIVISVVILVKSRGAYNTPKEAFVDLVNESGWSNTFIPWVTALGQAALSTTGFEAVSHFSSEMKDAKRSLPIGMVAAVGLNGVVGLSYAVILCFTLPVDPTSLLESTTKFPFAQFLFDKTQSVAGTVLMLVILLVPFWLTVSDVNMASARIVMQFANQGGLPSALGVPNKRLDSPVRAALTVAVIQAAMSFIYVGSSTAFVSFISVPGMVLGVSYGIVATLMLFRGRSVLQQQPPHFNLGAVLGPFCNVIAIIFSLLLLIFLSFPAVYPVDADTMNYTSVIIIAVFVSSWLVWTCYGRKSYKGPREE